MDARYIMDYSAFELMYEGIRHTTVEEHAEEWQLTAEQAETLKKRLLDEENRVYEYWLDNLPHFAVFEPDGRWAGFSYPGQYRLDPEWDAERYNADDTTPRLHYDRDAVDGCDYVGSDALTTVSRDLLEKVGNARDCVKSGLFPALVEYADELLLLLDDYDQRAVDYYDGQPLDSDDSAAALFAAGWRGSLCEAEDLFFQYPQSFEALQDCMSGIRSEYIDWMSSRVGEFEQVVDEIWDEFDEEFEASDYEYGTDPDILEDIQIRKEEEVVSYIDEIVDDLLHEAGLGEPQYLFQLDTYKEALSTEYGIDIYGRVLRALREQAGVDEA